MTGANATLLAAAVGLITGTIGILGTYSVAIRLENRKAKQLAGIELRKAFAPVLIWLKFTDWSDLHTISPRLKQDFMLHHIAIDQFSIYLSGKQWRNFKKAWYNYYGHDETELEPHRDKIEDILCFEKYDRRNDSIKGKSGTDKAIKNIEAILSFAETSKSKWYHLFLPNKLKQ